ncbi:Adenylyl/guanylyl cyclase [Perkinsus chesapeaki]|uniref:Adenylyl/guanylyl cyclase n=1 Tax=Perkinsus chesapeaki TaxID=330153 RepID=A0A7J6MNY3_PERCH|nr:Adenylyl/guanylyl cyclase [Perkinsus chesapeaki]
MPESQARVSRSVKPAWKAKSRKRRGLPSVLYSRWIAFCSTIVDKVWFSTTTTILTLYALFGDDVRMASFDSDADQSVLLLGFLLILNKEEAKQVICLLVFGLEIVFQSFGKPGYLGGFFFFLDVLSSASLVLDLTYVAEDLFGDGSGAAGQGDVARAGRMSRAGTKAGRVVRIIRLIRLIRIVKMYKAFLDAQQRESKRKDPRQSRPGNVLQDNESDHLPDDESALPDDFFEEFDKSIEPEDDEPESRVGKKLSERTTQKLIILILLMLFMIPVFTVSDVVPQSAQYGVDTVYSSYLSYVNECLTTGPLSPETLTHRSLYADKLFHFLYAHNWESREEPCSSSGAMCVSDYVSHLAWVGYYSEGTDPCWTHPHLENVTANEIRLEYDEAFNGDDFLVKSGDLSDLTVERITKPWASCGTDAAIPEGATGVSLIADIECPGDLRFNERTAVLPWLRKETDPDNYNTYFIFVMDDRLKAYWEAVLNMCQTLFICLVLGIGALFFSRDANVLVLGPIERMIVKLAKIKDNPLAATTLGDEEFRREETARARDAARQARTGLSRLWDIVTFQGARSSDGGHEPLETVMLEKTIIKIGSLLALGFGEAGAEIIGKNMQGAERSAGVNAMIPGRKVNAVFGFCDIRNFTDATEVLKDKVMLFVNQIGEIVHGIVDEFHGAPNKNIGDAFLIVWRLPEDNSDRRRKMCDMAIMSFVKVVAAINRSPVLYEYRQHPGLQMRLANYRVRMGFGMHCGWAIEGAIGSEFKIDASYLSPNVNVAGQLEAATKAYGVCMLLSGALIDSCNKELRRHCRIIDRVMIHGAPMGLFTIDLVYEHLSLAESASKPLRVHIKGDHHTSASAQRFRTRQEREARKANKWAPNYCIADLFDHHEDVIEMRKIFTAEFFKKFDMGFRNYEAGEWEVAYNMFCVTEKLLASEGYTDGPSAALKRYMDKYNREAPPTWNGARELP